MSAPVQQVRTVVESNLGPTEIASRENTIHRPRCLAALQVADRNGLPVRHVDSSYATHPDLATIGTRCPT